MAIIDQPGGPQQHRTNEMLGGAFLATLTVCVTGFASNDRLALWLVVIAQCFFYSMFTVFGKRGGLIGFAGLLVMALTMHSPLPADQVLLHAVVTFGGALFYLVFSVGFAACSGCARNSKPCRWRCSPPPTMSRRARRSTTKAKTWRTPIGP